MTIKFTGQMAEIVLPDKKDEVLAHTHVSMVMMPYLTSQFMPCTATDRSRVVREGCTNLRFIGQFVEVSGDVVFTIETSVRTPMEAVYALTGLDKDIIEVYPSQLFQGAYDEILGHHRRGDAYPSSEGQPAEAGQNEKEASCKGERYSAVLYSISGQGRIASELDPKYPKQK